MPRDTKISKLSIGQRQKLSIISALGHEPDLIILDEPVASLDPVARRSFLKELVDIASVQTRAIIFSTHIVSDLERVASRVWLIHEGMMALDAPMDELKESYAGTTVVLFRNWSAALHKQVESACGTVRAETLALEYLFLELHA